MARRPDTEKEKRVLQVQIKSTKETRAKQIDAYYKVIGDPDRQLLIAAFEGDAKHALQAIERGADVNALDEQTGMRPVHLAASGGFKRIVEGLIGSGRCDLTLRDARGRLASECAGIAAQDFDLADRLAEEQAKQFKETGKDPRRRAATSSEAEE